MKRREPTADEVAQFKLALKDTARLAPKAAGAKLHGSTKPKKLGSRAKTVQTTPVASPAPSRGKRSSKARTVVPAAPVQPESQASDAAMRGDARKAAQDRALFEAALKDAIPLDARALITVQHGPARSAAKASVAGAGASTPAPSGLDGRRRTKLRRGDLEPEARLDLHGLTETAAHHALTAFVHQAMARRLRLVLVVTGKGLSQAGEDQGPSDPLLTRRRGVLRQLTPRWLKEPELARFVAEMTPAHRRHGGEGALYVYLRKP
jgi:DNA-nicking Smr family endonuclease